MKSKKIDKIIFPWDHEASSSSNLRRNTPYDPNEQRCLDDYFDFLDQIKPHMHELRNTKMYGKPFTLI